ncbi:hypothetical protein [Acidisoma sp. L85]|uniref:hypothetical protein n=1 Tax=Acidisoma sp. L85 TaxID=1641850 RepID=UPI00131B8E36|nr:hypothetical protein [Acidisoma sp. L85]
MSDEIEIAVVSRLLQRVLEQSGRAILYDCRASKHTLAYAPDSAASPSGLLPAFLSAGNAVWREATGQSLGVEIATDPDTVLGYTVCSIRAGSVAIVLLSVMEAIEQAAYADSILVNDLAQVWRLAEDRMARGALARAPA